MNNIVILNALNISEYAYKELYQNRHSVSYAVESAGGMPEITEKAVLLPPGAGTEAFEGFKHFMVDDNTPSGLIEAPTKVAAGFDNIFYYGADCPLVDISLTQKMYSNHCRYFCEYTFADGFPSGISVEIIKPSILSMLAKLAEHSTEAIERDSIFSLIEKDINAFEIETEISPDDQRLLRVRLYPDTKRNFLQLQSIFTAVSEGSEEESVSGRILKTVRNRGELLRSLPIFFEFETSSAHPQQLNYMPENGGLSGRGNEMSLGDFKSALEKISGFSGDAVISLSVRNEPALHSDVSGLAAAVLKYDNFSLLIETSGIGWQTGQLDAILSMDSGKISWIVDLDALDRGIYEKLRGGGYDEAYAFAERLYAESPDNTWVQVVRMKENEEDNELFYKYWKERTNNVIIQKYDWCCGRLEQRKVTDLSPVKRLPCWHLKRELTVLVDGSVPLCRDDLDCETVLGNLFTDNIEEIWLAGSDIYRQHLDEEYPGICRNCDEYYTYNY